MAKVVTVTVSDLGITVEPNSEVKDKVEMINLLNLGIQCIAQDITKNVNIIMPNKGKLH